MNPDTDANLADIASRLASLAESDLGEKANIEALQELSDRLRGRAAMARHAYNAANRPMSIDEVNQIALNETQDGLNVYTIVEAKEEDVQRSIEFARRVLEETDLGKLLGLEGYE